MTTSVREKEWRQPNGRPLGGLLLLTAALVLGLVVPAGAQIRLDDAGKLTLLADLRLRFESDWDSRRADGSRRDDRDRLRIRARIGLDWKPAEPVSVSFRLRTGRRTSQQSPNLTFYDFEGGPNDPAEALFDRAFVSLGRESTSALFGRVSDPFWKQNELFWDDDVSLTGGTLSRRWRHGSSAVRLQGGFYALPDGMTAFAGNLGAAQLVYSRRGGRTDTTLASGVFLILGADETEHLRNGNGTRDYRIWTASAQVRFRKMRKPLTLGADFMHNFQRYSPDDPDPFTAAHHDQTTGFVLSVTLGETEHLWDWLASYSYARIETFAVNASFAQDDWVRWGSASQTDGSDFEGHELRLAVALVPHMNAVARLYLTEAITSVQDGKRFRLDLNYRF